MAYNSNFRSSEITGANPVTITNEAQVVVDLGYKSAGSRGVLLSEAPLKESPSTIVMTVGGTTFTEVDISAFTGAANTFAVEYASNSGVILLPPGTALGTATTTTYKGLGSVATIESKRFNPDGAVGAPSISFESDPDTGLYRIGANNMGFAAGGVRQGEFGAGYGGFTGNIIQVTNSVLTSQVSITTAVSNTLRTTGVVGSITTRVANSRIFIIINKIGLASSSVGGYVHSIIYRNTSTWLPDVAPVGTSLIMKHVLNGYSPSDPASIGTPVMQIDSPNVAAGTTLFYGDSISFNSTPMTFTINYDPAGFSAARAYANITLMEIMP